MTPPFVLVMAAGEGTRMRSSLPKVLHAVCGRPMVAWPILAAREAGAGRVAAIVSPRHDLSGHLPEGTETVVQPSPDGTGGAVRAAAGPIAEAAEEGAPVVVLSGDVPLVSAATVAELLEAHAAAEAAATVLSSTVEDPSGLGRVVRDAEGRVDRIVETKKPGDASAAELEIREVNAGVYAFEPRALLAALERIGTDNAQGELYLPDVLPEIAAAGGSVAAHVADDPAVLMGVNTRADLAAVEAEARRRLLEAHMLAGVTVADPASTWVDAGVEIAPDATILPGTSLRGATRIGAGATVGPHSTLTSAAVGEGATVLHSCLVECEIGEGCEVGPFAYVRPGTRLARAAKAGAFVEIKASEVGEGAKVPHLSYIGDAEIGDGANLGAGTITANYDGFRKHRTTIGEGARIGVDTMLIAPVDIGPGAYTGGGSVISRDVPPGALGVSRPEQRNIERYAERKAADAKEEEEEDS